MKEFKDYSTDDTFPITEDQTLTPVFRDFDDNIFTQIGVFIAEFIYPPVLVKDVVGKPKVQLNIDWTPFLLGIFIVISALLGMMCGIRWYLLYREQKRLNKIPLYIRLPELNDHEEELRLARCALEREQEEPPAPNLAVAEHVAVNESNESVINAIPIEVTDNRETAMKVKCDGEIMPSNCVDRKIMPSGPDDHNEEISQEPVGTTERIVRKRFQWQPKDRKELTINTEAMERKPTVRKPNIPEPVVRKIKTDHK